MHTKFGLSTGISDLLYKEGGESPVDYVVRETATSRWVGYQLRFLQGFVSSDAHRILLGMPSGGSQGWGGGGGGGYGSTCMEPSFGFSLGFSCNRIFISKPLKSTTNSQVQQINQNK